MSLLAGGFATIPVRPAEAQGFFDQLFGGSSRYDRRYERRRYDSRRGVFSRRGDPTDYRGGARIIHPEDTGVRISSPTYNTYRPDTLETVSLKALATAPAGDDEAMAGGADDLAANGDTAIGGTSAVLPDESQESASRMAADIDPARAAFDKARGHLADMRLKVLPEVGKAVFAFYKDNPGFVWVSDGRPNARARAAMAVMARAGEIGLSADDYRVELPDTRTAFNATGAAGSTGATGTVGDTAAATGAGLEAPGEALMRFEMILSAKVATYVLDATRGRVDPNRISGYHDLPRHKVDLTAALNDAAASQDIAAYLEGRGPQGKEFRALAAALAELQASRDDTQVIEISSGTFVRPGQSSSEMTNIVAAVSQRASDELKAKHTATLASYEGGETYTPELVALVRDFQSENNLKADGVVGPNTISTMTVMSNADKIEKVKLAMERLRWLPHELGKTRVFVNQPAYRVVFTRDGKTQASMKVVVGKRSNQTSFFYDELETVEYNPYWGVPLSIIVNEYLPKLAQNPYWFDDSGYEVTTPQGERISSAQVDWYAVATKQASVNVRQLPGRSNALGELKILFPNSHDIYMHDTPQKHLFSNSARAFSHGCIRLEDPRGMAAAVLGKSRDYIGGQIARGNNHSDPVPGKIPVYVSYFTAWPTAEGKVQYFDDVYGRDNHLERAIEATRAARGAAS